MTKLEYCQKPLIVFYNASIHGFPIENWKFLVKLLRSFIIHEVD